MDFKEITFYMKMFYPELYKWLNEPSFNFTMGLLTSSVIIFSQKYIESKYNESSQ